MEDMCEDFKGKRIPKKFRNKLVEWRADSPYDGCFWKMSHGCVDGDGNFHPINAEGRDLNDWMEFVPSAHGLVMGHKGLYDNSPGWCEREKTRIKEKNWFFSAESPRAYVSNLMYEAKRKAYGDMWWRVKDGLAEENPEIVKALGDSRERLEAYERDMEDFRRRRQERLNAVFMGALYDETPDEWALYPLSDSVIRHTCERFCRDYEKCVHVMCGVLDGLAELGYPVWCRCTDCGEMFQLRGYEKFAHLIDENAYHGNGGIGCVFTRVQCEQCREMTDCPQCHDPSRPTWEEVTSGHAYDHMSFREAFVAQWMGVCEYCADSFFRDDEHHKWSDRLDELEADFNGDEEELRKYLEHMKGQGHPDVARLEADNRKVLREKWRNAVNALRAEMQDDIEGFFEDSEPSAWRIDENDEHYVYN